MNSTVLYQVTRPWELSVTNITFKRFLSRMTSPMYRQMMATLKTSPTFRALEFTSMNAHMPTEGALTCKAFLTLGTRIQVFFSVSFHVQHQIFFLCKAFVARHAEMQLQIITIMCMLSDVNFSLHHRTTVICTYTTRNYTPRLQWKSACIVHHKSNKDTLCYCRYLQ